VDALLRKERQNESQFTTKIDETLLSFIPTLNANNANLTTHKSRKDDDNNNQSKRHPTATELHLSQSAVRCTSSPVCILLFAIPSWPANKCILWVLDLTDRPIEHVKDWKLFGTKTRFVAEQWCLSWFVCYIGRMTRKFFIGGNWKCVSTTTHFIMLIEKGNGVVHNFCLLDLIEFFSCMFWRELEIVFEIMFLILLFCV